MRGPPVSLAELLTGISILLSGLRGNVYIQLPLPGPFFTPVSIPENRACPARSSLGRKVVIYPAFRVPRCCSNLEIESGQGIKLKGVLQRFDGTTEIESWVFPVSVEHIAQMYEQSGIRLFARNVRGFLENTAVNRTWK